MHKKLIWSVFFLSMLVVIAYGKNQSGKMDLSKVAVLEYQQFDANQIRCWVGNNREIVSYNVTGNSGLEWPKFSGLYAIFQSGLWVAGMVDGEIRSAAAEYTSEYRPGSIIYDPQTLSRGVPNDPELSRYRIYKIQAGDDSNQSSPAYNADYADWPVADGAPAHDGEYFTDLNGNGVWDAEEPFEDYNLNEVYNGPDGLIVEGEDPPIISGDQMLWFVYNDMDEDKHANLWDTKPLGIEMQTTIWGFDTPELENIMFVKWLIINKSGKSIEDTYISMWSDPDVGDAQDDYVGCDTTLSLGYSYNGNPIDEYYGVAVPCVGYDFFQGPIVESLGDSAFASGQFIPDYRNLPMTSFVKYTNGSNVFFDPGNAGEAYNYMKGYMATGDPWIDIDGNITRYLYTGDPVTQTGYTEYDDDVPGDRRFLMNSGPFSLETWQDINGDNFPQVGEPGVQEIVGAILIERGSDHLSSIDAVKTLDRIAQAQYLYGNNRPSLVLISPRDGDVFSDTINVIWENISGYPEPDKIVIEFSNNDGASWTVVETLMGNPGFYQMLLLGQQDASHCKIRLTGYIKPDQLGVTVSEGNFRIDDPNTNGAPEVYQLAQGYGYQLYLSGDEEITWSVSDPENDDVSVTLEYKTKYEDWHVIADNLEDTFFWETNYFANTTDGRLRLRASDGFNETVVAMLPHCIHITNQRSDLICVNHINGASNANVSLATVDPNLCNQHQYEIRFNLTDSLRFSVYDLTNNQTVLENLVYYDNLNETPVFDGLTISIENSSFGYANALSGWITGKSNWTYDLENVIYFPSCYEVRFTMSGSVDTNGVQVPFEVWNTYYGYQSDFVIVVHNETMYYFGIYEEDQLGVEDVHWAVVIKAPSDTVSVPPVTGDILYLHLNIPINDDDVYQFTNQFVSVDRERYVPSDFQLYQNYPNPFNPTTMIRYDLVSSGFVKLLIYDLQGRLMRTLVSEQKEAGYQSVTWDGIDDNGVILPSGMYFYQLSAGSFSQVKKMMLVK